VQNDGCHWVARSWSVNSKTALDSITEENDLGNLWLEVEVAVSALQDGQDPQDALSLQKQHQSIKLFPAKEPYD